MFATSVFAKDEKTQELPQQTVVFITETGEHIINLEIAKTDYERTKGLMFRKTLADDSGMVFVYDEPTDAGIWMKNTFIPLDIIFVDCHNNVVDFVTRQPHTTEISYSPVKICKIIEVNAGLNEKITLKRGNKVNFKPTL